MINTKIFSNSCRLPAIYKFPITFHTIWSAMSRCYLQESNKQAEIKTGPAHFNSLTLAMCVVTKTLTNYPFYRNDTKCTTYRL